MAKYEQFVSVLCKSGDDVVSDMTSIKGHMVHMALGISGEAGELVDAVKKYAIYNKPLDRENVIEELGDLLFYIAGMCNSIGIKLDTVMYHNQKKLQKRYPNKRYTDSDAVLRADKNDN